VAVTIHDVQHIATLARLGLPAGRAEALVQELNTILGHMEVLTRVDTEGVQEAIGVGARGLPVRGDASGSVALERPLDSMAPSVRDGFLIVPRLATHETAEES
jgi:aspartyl-tRNA(Asn)/glutamyl-tRNA(Gln) amidotransferase subunit C